MENPILELDRILNYKKIEHFTRSLMDGYQIILPWCLSSVICHSGSYGHEKNLLEIKGLIMNPEEMKEDDVKGFLSVQEVIGRIELQNTCGKKQDKEVSKYFLESLGLDENGKDISEKMIEKHQFNIEYIGKISHQESLIRSSARKELLKINNEFRIRLIEHNIQDASVLRNDEEIKLFKIANGIK